jgi:hypothetical protein
VRLRLYTYLTLRRPRGLSRRSAKREGGSAALGGSSDLHGFSLLYFDLMTIEDLEKAVAGLSPDRFDQFRAWFDALDAARFDQKIERDAKAGKLDALADPALDDFPQGRAREL